MSCRSGLHGAYNYGNVERNAAGVAGAAFGASVGAISGDVKTGKGAIASAVAGGVIRASIGNRKDNQITGQTSQRSI